MCVKTHAKKVPTACPQGSPGTRLEDPKRPPDHRLSDFRNPTRAQEGLRKARLPLCPRPVATTRAVLRVDAAASGLPASSRRHPAAGSGDPSGHQEPSRDLEAPEAMGA